VDAYGFSPTKKAHDTMAFTPDPLRIKLIAERKPHSPKTKTTTPVGEGPIKLLRDLPINPMIEGNIAE